MRPIGHTDGAQLSVTISLSSTSRLTPATLALSTTPFRLISILLLTAACFTTRALPLIVLLPLLLTFLLAFLQPGLPLLAHLGLALSATFINLTPPSLDTGQDIGMISQGSADAFPVLLAHLFTSGLVLLVHGLHALAQLGPLG